MLLVYLTEWALGISSDLMPTVRMVDFMPTSPFYVKRMKKKNALLKAKLRREAEKKREAEEIILRKKREEESIKAREKMLADLKKRDPQGYQRYLREEYLRGLNRSLYYR